MIAQPLINYLKQLQAKGETHVSLEPQAREIMREFYLRAVQPHPTQAAPVPTTEKDSPSSPLTPTPARQVTGSSATEKLTSLRELWLQNPSLKALGTLRSKLVFPPTPQQSEIMFIGEAPSYHDERSGTPFVGPAGEKLDGILKAMKLNRSMVHVTCILKFRPSLPNQTTNNRSASTEELAAARHLIDQEILALKPKVIITLGEGAAQFFTSQQTDLDTIRTASYTYLSTPLITTYHPSFLLHNQDTKDKRRLWEDMLKAMQLIGLPIDEKQRGFFAPKKS